jgi:adenylate kinase
MIGTRVLMALGSLVLVPSCTFFSNKEKSCEAQTATIFTFLGAPGSGKGTLADQAVKDLGLLAVSTGNLLREAVARGDDLGKLAEGYMKKGALVPDAVVTDLMEAWLTKNSVSNKPIILDGYPRAASQAELFIELLKKKFPHVALRVVELTISDEAIIKRLADRLVCQKCQKVYSRTMISDLTHCPACGGPLIRRDDDKEEVIRERLKVYAQNINPIKDFYISARVPIISLPVEGKTPQQVFEAFKKLYETVCTGERAIAHS